MIDDKTLDEHVERAKDISDWSENGPAVYVIADLLGDITALRAEVGRLEKENRLMNDTISSMAIELYEARQVTREQALEAVLQAARACSVYAPLFAKPIPDGFCLAVAENLNLKIVEEAPVRIDSEGSKALKNALLASGKRVDTVEEAPKAEGRECRCKSIGRDVAGRHVYHCPKSGNEQIGRCTITERERDETR